MQGLPWQSNQNAGIPGRAKMIEDCGLEVSCVYGSDVCAGAVQVARVASDE